ncbi:MAG: helix-turn-helix transcriptional regulator, partial [Lentisphaeria bacterium]|nr:helix-turn-helix transcriptional regulator [Lentisphaeria bacterium]
AVDFATECHKAFHSGCADMEALSDYAYSTIRWKSSPHQSSVEIAFPEPLKRALTYIQMNYTSEIDPENIAEKSNLSRPYLFALFREYMKTTPYHYILQQRIGKAKLLLSGGLTPIKEIALLCGFDSLEVFYRQFKKETNLTPADYRKKYSAYPESWGRLCALQNLKGK